MVWDLSQLVESEAPEFIIKKLDSMIAEVEDFRNRYHGKIWDFNAKELLELLEFQDRFYLKFEGITLYCRLIYSADSTSRMAKRLNNVASNTSMKVRQSLAFLDTDIGELLSKNPSLISDPILFEYKHYLERIYRRQPHMLSEKEERLTIIKDRNGIRAWQMLQGDWLSTRTFNIEIDGEVKTLPYGEIIGLYEDHNRDLRKQANQVVYENLGKDEIIWASAIRAVCGDHLRMCELRKYPAPVTQSLIANDVDLQAIYSLMNAVENNVVLYQRYLRLKAKLMDLPKLANYDIVAPLPLETKYSWRQARSEVIKAYAEFDNEIGDWVNEMYETRHIDGEVRKGKRSGAFCSRWLAGKSAYILQSFNEKIGDVYTQAHELGHAVHAYLGSRAQKPSNNQIGSCIAECGSIFGELLLTEHLLKKAKTKEEKQVVLVNLLDEFGTAVFQVSARFFFEQSMYDLIEKGEFLDGETIANLWTSARDKIYYDTVDWLEAMKWEWTMKVHYYIANYRFYNYPYVFAYLFVFGLYRTYKEEGKTFVSKMKNFLASGSSKSPHELGLDLGLDIADEKFWEKGMKQAEEFIDLLEETIV